MLAGQWFQSQFGRYCGKCTSKLCRTCPNEDTVQCEFPDTTVQFVFREAGNPEFLVKSPIARCGKRSQ